MTHWEDYGQSPRYSQRVLRDPWGQARLQPCSWQEQACWRPRPSAPAHRRPHRRRSVIVLAFAIAIAVGVIAAAASSNPGKPAAVSAAAALATSAGVLRYGG